MAGQRIENAVVLDAQAGWDAGASGEGDERDAGHAKGGVREGGGDGQARLDSVP